MRATMIFSEKWFCVARSLQGEAKLKYLEAVLNYGLLGATPPEGFNEEAAKAFANSKYEIELLNPKAEFLWQGDTNYVTLDPEFKTMPESYEQG